jgi:hypothetical protein
MSASWIVYLILALSPTLVNRQRALFKVLKFICVLLISVWILHFLVLSEITSRYFKRCTNGMFRLSTLTWDPTGLWNCLDFILIDLCGPEVTQLPFWLYAGITSKDGCISTWYSGRANLYTNCRLFGDRTEHVVQLVLHLDIDTSPSTETLNSPLEMK